VLGSLGSRPRSVTVEIRNAKRAVYHVDQHLDDVPERIFPLLCPVREYDWIDGWSCARIYADTGVAELGGIFRTAFPDVSDEIWTISRYEPNRVIEFVRVAWNVVVVKLDIALESAGDRRTRVRMTHTYTALSQAGELLIAAQTPAIHEQELRELERMLNHYLRTGQKLPRPAGARPIDR
jgi:hypothetical protein